MHTQSEQSTRLMNMQRISEYIERLRQWQVKPNDYEFATHEEQHCHNCDHQFTGNYCPYCSQKAGVGPVGWASVRQSVMDVWGLGSRSLPRTIGHLLLRPGYLIGDYISGRRQVSFPPVKMLFIVALVVVFWLYYFLPIFLGDSFDVFGGRTEMFDGFTEWTRKHFVWTYFIMSLFYILPSWVMFRYSPRHTRHTLPQDFFIQVFMLVLQLVVSFLALTPLLFWDYNLYFVASAIAVLAYFVIAYKQLFGYGVWGTLWRVIIIFLVMALMLSTLAYLVFDFDPSKVGGVPDPTGSVKYFYAGITAFLALLIMALGWGINLIATRKVRRQMSNNHNNQ